MLTYVDRASGSVLMDTHDDHRSCKACTRTIRIEMSQKQSSEFCPRCRENGEVSKLLFVYYNRAEAFSTCQKKDCVFFVTESTGDPIKFQFSEKSKHLVPLTNAEVKNTNEELEELMRKSLQDMNSDESQITKEKESYSGVPDSGPDIRRNFDNEDSALNYSDNFDFDSFLKDFVPN